MKPVCRNGHDRERARQLGVYAYASCPVCAANSRQRRYLRDAAAMPRDPREIERRGLEMAAAMAHLPPLRRLELALRFWMRAER